MDRAFLISLARRGLWLFATPVVGASLRWQIRVTVIHAEHRALEFVTIRRFFSALSHRSGALE